MVREILICTISLVLAPTVLAQSLAYEGFDYTVGQSINTQTGGTGWANAWSTSSAANFTSFAGSTSDPTGTLLTSGNQIRTSGTASFYETSRTTSLDLRSAPNSSVWISFTARRIDPFATTTYGGLVIGNEVGSAGSNTGRLFVGDPGGANTWALERGGGGVFSYSNHAVTANPSLLVVNIQFQDNGAETILLYANRPPGGDAPASVDAFLGSLDLNPSNGAVTNLSLWFSGAVYQFDEIRIGHSYAEVTPIPEPGAILSIAVGLLTTGAWVRRFTSRKVRHATATAR